MIDKFENNTKIKLISLVSAIVLWLYVMAVVDPEETKLFEDIPITINNMNQLNEKNLVIYPDTELTTDIYIYLENCQILRKLRRKIYIYMVK